MQTYHGNVWLTWSTACKLRLDVSFGQPESRRHAGKVSMNGVAGVVCGWLVGVQKV